MKVWYIIKGEPCKATAVDDGDLHDLKEKVIEQNPDLGLVARNMSVFEAGANPEIDDPLDPGEKGSTGTSSKNPLIIEHSQSSSAKKRYGSHTRTHDSCAANTCRQNDEERLGEDQLGTHKIRVVCGQKQFRVILRSPMQEHLPDSRSEHGSR